MRPSAVKSGGCRPSSTHVCRSPGTISGPRSVLPEPDPNSKPPLSLGCPHTGGAVLEYGPTEILPPVGPMLPRSARLSRPRRSPRPHTRGKPRLLDVGRRIPARDRFAPDSPLEGRGFEPAVPLDRDQTSTSRFGSIF